MLATGGKINSSNFGINSMKNLSALFIVMICMLAVSVAAQSVADAARQNRANRKANASAQVIDNDVIPSVIQKSSAETASAEAKSGTQKDESAGKKDAKAQDTPAATEPEKPASADKSAESWKKKVAEQKHEIAQLQRELDVAEREARLRAAAYYADAGVMLRDQERYAQDSRKQQAEIDSKKQAVADAKQKLEDLQEQARKAGIAASQLD